MANLPSAIIFMNDDVSQGIIDVLTHQLFLNEIISGTTFDQRIADSNDGYTYPDDVRKNNLRILVLKNDLRSDTNHEYADVVIFVKQGLATVLKNKLGPPTQSFPIDRVNAYALLRAGGSAQVVTLPSTTPSPPFSCSCNNLRGIFALQSSDTSGVHCPNSDNIFNNPDFINRK